MLVQYTRQRYVQWTLEWITRDMPAPAIGIPKVSNTQQCAIFYLP
jgi:hypothetical protein